MKTGKIITLKPKHVEPERPDSSGTSGKHPTRIFLFSLGLVIWLLVTSLLAPSVYRPLPEMNEGDISSRKIRAPHDFLVEDIITTEKNRDDIRINSPDLYDLDKSATFSIKKRVERAFFFINDFYKKNVPHLYDLVEEDGEANKTEIDNETLLDEMELALIEENKIRKSELKTFEISNEFKEAEKEFQTLLGVNLTNRMLMTLRWHHYRSKIRQDIVVIVGLLMKDGIVRDKGEEDTGRRVIIREIGTKKERTLNGLSSVRDLKEAPEIIKRLVFERISQKHNALRWVAQTLCKDLTKVNLTLNKEATENYREEQIQSQKTVFFKVQKGEIIVREGEPVTKIHVRKLEAFSSAQMDNSVMAKVAGKAIFVFLFVYLFWSYLKRFNSDIVKDRQGLLLISFIFLINIALVRFMLYGIDTYSGFGENQQWYYFMIPFALGPELISILFTTDLTIIFSIVNALVAGFMIENGFVYAVVSLAGGLVAINKVNKYRQRSAILKTGLLIGVVNVIVIVPICLIDNTLYSQKGIMATGSGLLSGILVAVMVSALLPLIESIFHYYSDIKLLELSDLNHPLLSSLVLKSPGTYHHSIMVGTLSEKAAEAAGANPLLCRVASYYHDVGKIKKPEYFIENQKDAGNRHDSLSPSMSCLIINSHVKDGVELAKEHRLIPKIIDIIKEHHGTSLISYFYSKAKKSENASIQPVNEDVYRYPGPKPRTKESAIVLLADSIEAASRTLDDPTHSRLKGLIKMIVEEKIMDGQLSDSHLTLNDLQLIQESFLRSLRGIFHSRIEYPKVEKGKTEHGNTDTKQSKDGKDKQEEAKRKDPKDFRSVRMS